MSEAMIGLISAVGVVAVEKAAEYISARTAHKEQRQDREEEKESETLDEIRKLQGKIEGIDRKISDNSARESRIRILRFEDEIRHGVMHSKDHFEQIMEDINSYREYCDSHKDFHNGIGCQAMKRIEEIYGECAKDNTFL